MLKLLGRRSRTPAVPLDQPYLSRLGDMPRSLIFIMGPHRSGTSLLYHLLAGTGQFDYVSAYDVVDYDELLFNRIHGREQSRKRALQERIVATSNDRLIDGLPVGADLPEEYRFILLKEKANRLPQRRTLLFSPHLTAQSRDRFVQMCRKKRFLTLGDKPLLLKNPNDFYRNFRTVHGMFPQAKFLFIHRHPLQVFNSNMRAWCLALRKKSEHWALLDAHYARLFRPACWERKLRARLLDSALGRRHILSGLIDGYEYYLEKIKHLPPDSFLSLRYEDLCQDPGAHLARIGCWLGHALLPSGAGQLVNPRALEVPHPVQACYEKRLDALAPYLRDQRYPIFPETGLGACVAQRSAGPSSAVST